MVILDIPLIGEVFSWVIAAIALIMGYRLFSIYGLYTFIAAAVIIGNIQVYKIINSPAALEPIGLGTALMSLTFVVTDFLTEWRGKATAQKAIYIGFFYYFLFVLLLGITVIVPLAEDATPFHQSAHAALKTLFLPAPGIFCASLIAYFSSQLLDVSIFAKLKQDWNGRNLGIRAFISSSIATLVDNAVFSILAWIVFHPHPLPFEIVCKTFILGGTVMRIFLSLINTPLVILLRKIKPAYE